VRLERAQRCCPGDAERRAQVSVFVLLYWESK
jgi:hypothetical protein